MTTHHAARRALSSSPPAAEAADHIHLVVPGDNLWTIAAAELSRQTGRSAEADIRDYLARRH